MRTLKTPELLLSLLALAVASVGLALPVNARAASSDQQAVVVVTLKNGDTEQFDYNSFNFGWAVRDSNCTLHQWEKASVTQVDIVGLTYSECDKANSWELIYYIVDGKATGGHISPIVNNTAEVSGRDPKNGATKRIKYGQIRSITFQR